MPTYQYVCTECGGQIEAVQRFTDEPLSVHEACGGRLRKVYSAVGIVFKGSGFYRTDSRSGSSSTVSASAAASEKSAEKSSSGGSADSSSSSSGTDKGSSTSTAPNSSGEKVA